MNLVCIDNIEVTEDSYEKLPLTIGKVYESQETTYKGVYKIIADNGLVYLVDEKLFTTLQLWREYQIDLILNQSH
jgi:hypothetical protein